LHNCSVTLLFVIFTERCSFAKCYTASQTYKTGFFSSFMYWQTLYLLKTEPLFFRLIEREPFYVFRVYPMDVQLDPSSAVVCSFCVSDTSCAIILVFSPFWLHHFSIHSQVSSPWKHSLCASEFHLYIFWTVWDCSGRPCVAKGAQISQSISQFSCNVVSIAKFGCPMHTLHIVVIILNYFWLLHRFILPVLFCLHNLCCVVLK